MQQYSKALLSIFSLIGFSSVAQQTVTDTIRPSKVNQLEEVVVTGQIEPQSIKKSIQNVRVISKQDIQQLAANNLGDVLNQYINITVRPSGTDGRSTVSMFGLDALYFKILIDNVPIVSEAGLGNNIDLSQINLNDVERIEIIEGSMGVTHGANAVSGILNIITKKSSQHKWEVAATVQEETVRDEFGLFDKGRHIQALKISHSISENWFVSVNANRNDFRGWLDNKKGENHFLTDSLRGYRWLPKEQLTTNALISYNKNNFRMFYRFEMLNEDINYYNNNVEPGFSTELGSYRVATDKRYATDRYYHHLNAGGKLFSQLNYNVSLSHQKQAREVESYRYFIQQDLERPIKKGVDQSMEVLYSTGTLSNFFKDKKVDLQLGYEFVNNNGFSTIEEEGSSVTGIRKRIENYDFFVSSEINVSERFSLRPGLRYSVQSKFDDQYASSLGFRQSFNNGIELRGALGQSFRTPTFEELYTRMIFSGHYYTGNPDLKPETSTSYEVSLRKTTSFNSGLLLSNNVTVSYMDIKDRIDTALVGFLGGTGGIPMYESININKYNMWNLSSTNQIRFNNWNFSLGATLVGVSQLIDNGISVSDDKYLYTLNLNASASYRVQKWNTVFAAYYKYNGEAKRFQAKDNGYELVTLDDSNWLDASVTKSFFKNKFDVTLGSRNILDITNINQRGSSQSGSHAASTSLLQAYGRSYYAKLTYNLNF